VRTVFVLFFVGWCTTVLPARSEGQKYAGRPLGDVLRELQRAGLNIVFSSGIVRPTMKVLTEPKAAQPRLILDEILRPHGLQVRSGPRGTLLIVRFSEQKPPPATVPGQAATGASTAPVGPEFRESVTVSARPPSTGEDPPGSASPIVDVKNATVGTTFGADTLSDIPNQRDIFALLAQTPGITMPRADVGGNTAGTQSAYRAYGLAGQSITTVDGVNITVGSAGVGAYLDYGAMAEAKVAAAGNSAEVPVAGAVVTTVIKSGSNTHHGELFADVKPGGGKRYTGAEVYLLYRDLNGQLGGPFVKDRFWYFFSVRNQHTAFKTGMYDRPAAQGGEPGQPFTTETTDYTLKLNHRLNRTSTLTFMTQWGRKHQPHRLGSGVSAYQYVVESTAFQNSWSEIGKVDLTRVLNSRATLDASVNIFATQFPLKAHTDKTPIIDDVTFARSGAYNTPSYTEDRRWHYNTNLNILADHHDMKIGFMYHWYAPRFTSYGAPGPAGTAGHFTITTTNGVPSSFSTDNGPMSSVNVLKNHALFFQDRFQLTSTLTLNYGIRFDQYHSSYPEQRFGLEGGRPCDDDVDCDAGPFAVQTVTPARDVASFNTLVPRVALIHDLFGNSKTALKGSWGRYSTNPAELISSLVNPIELITRKYAWDTTYLTANPGVAATRITPAYVATLQPIFGGAQLTPAAVDAKLKDSYTDEYVLGVEQEVASDLRVYSNFIRKRQKNAFGRYDRLRTFSTYSPVQALDPGPDGAIRTPDDRTITVWETGVPPDTTDFYLTNKPIGDTYSTVEFGVTKRMSNHWQLTSSFDWTKRDLSSLFAEDPNTVFWNSNNTQTTGWTLKASGSYLFSRGLMISAWYNGMKGEPYGRLFTVTEQNLKLANPNRTTPLVQGNMTIIAEKAGSYYLPAVHVINVRVQKEFVIKRSQRLHLMLNLFNVAGATTVTGVNQATGTNFNQPTINLGGAVVRFSMRYIF